MGEWEQDSGLRCVDCGMVIREDKATARKHFYLVQRDDPQKVVLCPACWTTARIHPLVKRSA